MTISPSMLKKKTFKKTFRNRVLLPFSFVYLPCSISFCLYPPEQAGRSRILLNFTLKTVVCAWKNHDPPSGSTCWGWNTSIMIHNLHYRIIKCSGLEETFKRYLVQCLFSEKGHLQLPREPSNLTFSDSRDGPSTTALFLCFTTLTSAVYTYHTYHLCWVFFRHNYCYSRHNREHICTIQASLQKYPLTANDFV